MTIGRIPSVEGGIQPTIVDAKGDLIAATAADTVNRLAVGSNDQVLVADSAASTGLAWKSYGAQFVAGKNKIINGDFNVWQRGTSFSNPTSGTYTADRFIYNFDGTGATRTISQQTFTPGTAPVAGYEGAFFWRMAQTVAGSGGTYQGLAQRIEDVRTFAGQTVTFSFWIKASGSLNVQAQYGQVFGSGGSSGVYAQSGSLAVNTSWQRLSWTVTLPSISGKTIGTNPFLEMYILLPVNTTQTIDTWGWQLEAGSVATPFTTATGTIQGELAACQRYYYRQNASATNVYQRFSVPVGAASSTQVYTIIPTPVTMRTTYTSIDTTSGLALTDGAGSFVNVTSLSVDSSSSQNLVSVTATVASGLVTNRPYYLVANNSSTPFVGLSAEL